LCELRNSAVRLVKRKRIAVNYYLSDQLKKVFRITVDDDFVVDALRNSLVGLVGGIKEVEWTALDGVKRPFGELVFGELGSFIVVG
jgi:hypothetical protein